MHFVKAYWTVVVPLLLIIVVAIVLLAMGDKNASWMVSNLGTAVVMLLNILYIAFWHSRSRWPGLSWSQRLTKVVWFER